MYMQQLFFIVRNNGLLYVSLFMCYLICVLHTYIHTYITFIPKCVSIYHFNLHSKHDLNTHRYTHTYIHIYIQI